VADREPYDGTGEGRDGTAVAFGPYGLGPLVRFLTSYRRHDSGAAHDLVIAWKDWTWADWSLDEAAAARELLAETAHIDIMVPNGGFDLGTYRHIVRLTDHGRYCFLNSNSELLAPDWLAKLGFALDRPSVVAAGATASFQSLATDMMRMVGMRRTWRAVAIAKRLLIHLRLRRLYPSFPNPHLRTNGFMIRRDDFLAVAMKHLHTKQDATRFESGWHGMTRQLRAKGGTIMLVDAAGRILDERDWSMPEMFWHGDQRLLLIADNQTRRYADADAAERETLFRYAWTPLKG
jgi:hypothetical protein